MYSTGISIGIIDSSAVDNLEQGGCTKILHSYVVYLFCLFQLQWRTWWGSSIVWNNDRFNTVNNTMRHFYTIYLMFIMKQYKVEPCIPPPARPATVNKQGAVVAGDG